MDSIRSVLPTVLAKRGLAKQATAEHVAYTTHNWLMTQASALLPYCHRIMLIDGDLVVHCTHSAALQEFEHHAPLLLAHLKASFPLLTIHNVRVTRSLAA